MLWRGRRRPVTELVRHPNLDEITGIVGQIPLLGDEDLCLLGRAWLNTTEVVHARARALDPDCPLVVDVLRAFESISTTFRDIVAATERQADAGSGVKALRDAVAGSFARPRLTRREHKVLLRPWHTAFPSPHLDTGMGVISPYF